MCLLLVFAWGLDWFARLSIVYFGLSVFFGSLCYVEFDSGFTRSLEDKLSIHLRELLSHDTLPYLASIFSKDLHGLSILVSACMHYEFSVFLSHVIKTKNS